VEPGAEPPTCTTGVDWVRTPIDVGEVALRCTRLLAVLHPEPVATVDEDGILRLGAHLRVLAPGDARILRLLIERAGCVVGREEVAAALWPGETRPGRACVDGPIRRLRERIAGLPLEVEAVWGRGFRLVVSAPDADRPLRAT